MKYLYIGWDKFHQDTKKLAQKLKDSSKTFDGILGISRGGLFPAAVIAYELDLRLVQTICMASYHGYERRQGIEVLASSSFEDKNWLVLDDLVDTGQTFYKIKEIVPSCYNACIYAKPKGEQSADVFFEAVPQDTWVVFPWDADPQQA